MASTPRACCCETRSTGCGATRGPTSRSWSASRRNRSRGQSRSPAASSRARLCGEFARPTTGQWKTRLDRSRRRRVYLRIGEISASTPHELRKLAPLMESEGVKARGDRPPRTGWRTQLHPAVLLADCLLERGTIGRVRTANGEQTYQAEPDAVFRGWPMAVLIDGNTLGNGGVAGGRIARQPPSNPVGRPMRSASGRPRAS